MLKFRGAGQGPKALIAELVAGELARAAGLRVPEIVLVELDPDLARTEPDPEIQDLIRASAGLNLANMVIPSTLLDGGYVVIRSFLRVAQPVTRASMTAKMA